MLVDGQPTRSCVTKAAAVGREAVTTIEGLEDDGRLHPVQEAFLEVDAMQCGYCTPGMIVEGVALLRRTARPERSRDRARDGAARLSLLHVSADRPGHPPGPPREAAEGREPADPEASDDPERYELPSGFLLGRRVFLELLGGVVVLAVAGRRRSAGVGAARRRRQGPPTSDLSAWLHVAEDGTVTVYTGKVEVGQNIRTSLAQAVAEELRAPLASIQLVMADTDLTPFDVGTFGSRTTPTMAPVLRKAAAVAREMLKDLAAAEWQRGRERARRGGRTRERSPAAAAPSDSASSRRARSSSGA